MSGKTFLHRLTLPAEDFKRLAILGELERFANPVHHLVDLNHQKSAAAERCVQWSMANGVSDEMTDDYFEKDRMRMKFYLPVDYFVTYSWTPAQLAARIHRALAHYFGHYRNGFETARGRVSYWDDALPTGEIDSIGAEAFRLGLDHRSIRMDRAAAQLAEARRILRMEIGSMVDAMLPVDETFRREWAEFEKECENAGVKPESVFHEAGRRLHSGRRRDIPSFPSPDPAPVSDGSARAVGIPS